MNELSLFDIGRALARKFWLILIVSLTFAFVTFIYTSVFAIPVYKSKSSILITNGGIVSQNSNLSPEQAIQKMTNSDISASNYIKETCKDLLLTKKMFALVAEKSGLDYTDSQIQGMITLKSRSEDSLLLDIFASGTDKEDLVVISNTFADACQEYLAEHLPSAYIAPADRSEGVEKISPRIATSTAFAFLLGAFIIIVPVLFIEFTDNAIKGEEDFSSKYDISILGVVPDFIYSSKGGKKNG